MSFIKVTLETRSIADLYAITCPENSGENSGLRVVVKNGF